MRLGFEWKICFAVAIITLFLAMIYLSSPVSQNQADEELVETKTLLITKNGTELIRIGEFQEGLKFKRIDIKDAYIEILLKDGVVFVYYNGTTRFNPYNVSTIDLMHCSATLLPVVVDGVERQFMLDENCKLIDITPEWIDEG